VDAEGVARISEHGLGHVLWEESSSALIAANARWMAPEVISADNKEKRETVDGRRADVYSLGTVIADVGLRSQAQVCVPRFDFKPQVLAGIAPFSHADDEDIWDEDMLGPEPPSDGPSEELVDELWELSEVCCSQDPRERPRAKKVLETLEALVKKQAKESPQESLKCAE
jgi:serine/threonine protein kinase